ncbi:hypothetical protein H9Q74_009878 [Fusarium xylarioides]|nr:hypothetical protein H9Q71_011072 [Fusarium xylarioides]KAG5818742.1 hypothetical protein H9Q74_009878 [Fusarium xylarioides]
MDLTYRSDEPSVVPSPLPQSVGYGVVVAAGLAFAFGMMGLTAILKKTLNEDNSKVETFMVANRTVRTGLVASAVVSSWLWSTALLSCVLVTYSYGISGAFWYGAGCSTVIVFFGYLGTACKGRVPEAHTILEVIRIRYGTVAHLSFTFLAIVNNLLNTINMILGASAAISFLTGMHIMATGLGVWLGSAFAFSGEVTVASTGGTLPCMYGTVASLFSPLLYSVVITYVRPDNYDWSQFKEQRLAVEPDESSSEAESSQGKGSEQVTSTETVSNENSDDNQRRWTKYALYWAVATFLGHWVLWPLPMYAAKFVFSKQLFTAWIVVSLIWLWWTLIMVGFYPIWNGRGQIAAVTRSIWKSQS